MAKKKIKIDEFIKSGEFKGLKLGQNISELVQKKLIRSNCEDENGRLYDYLTGGARVTIIVKENIIKMIMIKINSWNESLTLSFGNKT